MAQNGEQKTSGVKLRGGAIVSVVGLAALLVFVLQNTETIKFDFLFFNFSWPLWFYTIMVAVFGAIAWFGLGVMRRHRRRVRRRTAR
jgi:uncharacterized integral membrane protein